MGILNAEKGGDAQAFSSPNIVHTVITAYANIL